MHSVESTIMSVWLFQGEVSQNVSEFQIDHKKYRVLFDGNDFQSVGSGKRLGGTWGPDWILHWRHVAVEVDSILSRFETFQLGQIPNHTWLHDRHVGHQSLCSSVRYGIRSQLTRA